MVTYYGELYRKLRHHLATQRTRLQPPMTIPSLQQPSYLTGLLSSYRQSSRVLRSSGPTYLLTNLQSNLVSQIASKRCQMQRSFVLTAYGHIPSPYPTTVPLSTAIGISSPRSYQQIKFKTAAKL